MPRELRHQKIFFPTLPDIYKKMQVKDSYAHLRGTLPNVPLTNG